MLLVFRATFFAVLIGCPIFLAQHMVQRSHWNKQRLYRQLLAGNEREQLRAAAALVQVNGEAELLRVLQEGGSEARDMAKKALEFLWFNAAGSHAFRLVQSASNATDQQQLQYALALLNRLVKQHQDFAEGWNQRASVYWQMGEWEKSIEDSRRALELNPNHYGAWQGLGVCLLKLGEIDEACHCLKRALEILPYDTTTRDAVRECEKLLREQAPKGKSSGQLMSARMEI